MKRSMIQSAKKVVLGLLLVGLLVSAVEAVNRRFYITKAYFTGSQALTACAKGYHMASFYEIREISNFTYDPNLGVTQADSGSGPPADFPGWIRSGLPAVTVTYVGANCAAWTSASNSDHGTLIYLDSDWTSPSTVMSPWTIMLGLTCDYHRPVWCVSNK